MKEMWNHGLVLSRGKMGLSNENDDALGYYRENFVKKKTKGKRANFISLRWHP